MVDMIFNTRIEENVLEHSSRDCLHFAISRVPTVAIPNDANSKKYPTILSANSFSPIFEGPKTRLM